MGQEVCGVTGGTAKVYASPALGVNGFAAGGLGFAPAVEFGVKLDVPFLPEIKRALVKLPDDLK